MQRVHAAVTFLAGGVGALSGVLRGALGGALKSPEGLKRLLGVVVVATLWDRLQRWWSVDAWHEAGEEEYVLVWDVAPVPGRDVPGMGEGMAPRQVRRTVVDALGQRGLAVRRAESSLWREAEVKQRKAVAKKSAGHFAPHYVVDVVSVPFEALAEGAERLGLRKRLRARPRPPAQRPGDDGRGFTLLAEPPARPTPAPAAGPPARLERFCRSRAREFDGYEAGNRHFFTTDERQRVCLDVMMSLRTGLFRSVLPQCAERGLLVRFQPLHDGAARRRLLHYWVRTPGRDDVLDGFEAYLGGESAFYFAFCASYTSWLWLPAAGGLAAHLWGGPAVRLALSVLVSLWTTVFLQVWRRRSARLAMRWGAWHLDEDDLIDEPRAGFRGEPRLSAVTGRMEASYPAWKRRVWYALSVPCNAALLAALVLVVWACLEASDALADNESKVVAMLPTVVRGASVPLLNALYHRVAEATTRWENHRTERGHRHSLTVKLALFYAANNYLGLCYLAFWTRDVDRLGRELGTLMVTTQLTGQLSEVLVPWAREVMNSEYDDGHNHGAGAPACDGCGAAPAAHSPVAAFERETRSAEYGGVFPEYVELVIQFGYVVMFGWAWPLAAVLALANNTIEVRSDAFKMLTVFRRPVPHQARGIGPWLRVLEAFSYAGVATNCAYAAITLLDDGEAAMGALPAGASATFVLGAVVAAEHALYVCKALVEVLVPPLPSAVREELARERFAEREAERARVGGGS